MPRNGDGSSDNGPIEAGQDAVHGASGDATLQHTKNNVAPMPEIEKGEAIEGMNASGAGDAPKQATPAKAKQLPTQTSLPPSTRPPNKQVTK